MSDQTNTPRAAVPMLHALGNLTVFGDDVVPLTDSLGFLVADPLRVETDLTGRKSPVLAVPFPKGHFSVVSARVEWTYAPDNQQFTDEADRVIKD